MANILDAAGRKIVEDKYFVAAREQRVGQMRSNKSSPACD
jgi:hypothetical protein